MHGICRKFFQRKYSGIDALLVLEGEINEVIVQRGLPRRNWLDYIKEQTNPRDYSQLKRSAEDRNYLRDLHV